MSQDPRLLDQVLFGWAERTLTGSSGVGPVLSSLQSETELAQWEHRLLAADWAAAAVVGSATVPALVYLRFADQAVVMRKETVTDPHGRGGSPLTHALIGHESVLDAWIALGLHDWTGWIRKDNVPAGLGLLDGAQLRVAADAGYRTLRDRAQRLNHNLLAALVATFLSDPSGRFSVYPPDEPTTAVPAAELMCGILDVLGEIGGLPWTFSTGEEEEPATASRPRVVFLRKAKGFSTRGATGHSVTVGQFAWRAKKDNPENEARLHDFGVALADGYSRMGPSVIDSRRPPEPICTLGDAIAWSVKAQIVPGVLDDFGYLLLAIGENQIDSHRVAAFKKESGFFDRGIAAMSAEVFSRLVVVWGPGKEAAQAYPEIAEAIRREAAWRFAVDGRPPGGEIAMALGAGPVVWLDQLGRCRAERGRRGLLDAAARIAPLLSSEANGEVVRLLAAELAPADMLVLAHDWSRTVPTVSTQLLIAVAAQRAMTESQRADCRARLREFRFLVPTMERCFPHDPHSAGNLLARLLSTIFTVQLTQRETVDRIIDQVSRIRGPSLLWGLAASVPESLRGRVMTAAGNVWFEDNGLRPFSISVPEPDEGNAGPSATQAAAFPAPDVHLGAEIPRAARQPPEQPQEQPRRRRGPTGIPLPLLVGFVSFVVIVVIVLVLAILDGLKL
jgi:hypothetical protein